MRGHLGGVSARRVGRGVEIGTRLLMLGGEYAR